MPRAIDSESARRLVADEGGILVEVLPAPEYEEIHLAGAVNVPLKSLNEQAVSGFDKARPIIVYCYDFL